MSYKYVFFVGTYMISINYYFYRIIERKYKILVSINF